MRPCVLLVHVAEPTELFRTQYRPCFVFGTGCMPCMITSILCVVRCMTFGQATTTVGACRMRRCCSHVHIRHNVQRCVSCTLWPRKNTLSVSVPLSGVEGLHCQVYSTVMSLTKLTQLLVAFSKQVACTADAAYKGLIRAMPVVQAARGSAQLQCHIPCRATLSRSAFCASPALTVCKLTAGLFALLLPFMPIMLQVPCWLASDARWFW